MKASISKEVEPQFGMINPNFEILVQRIIQTVHKDRLAELRRDFHTRLRITLSAPENSDLIEDLWDFFYDWCVFEQNLPEGIGNLSSSDRSVWINVKGSNQRGLCVVQKAAAEGLRLKELYTAKTFIVPKKGRNDFLGIARGDILECRLFNEMEAESSAPRFSFVRRPSYHPAQVHSYIKKKVRQFKKSEDYSTYQSWLWLLVGMYLKHRIYHHMPIEKIYDDNSRI